MHGAEERWTEKVTLIPRGDAHVIPREGGFEWVDCSVQPTSREVVAEALGDHDAEGFLGCFVERLMEDGIVDPVGAFGDGVDQGDESGFELVEDDADLRGLHPWLVLIDQGIVGMILVSQTLGLLTSQLEGRVQTRREFFEPVVLAGANPYLARQGGVSRRLGYQGNGQLSSLVPVLSGHPHQAGFHALVRKVVDRSLRLLE